MSPTITTANAGTPALWLKCRETATRFGYGFLLIVSIILWVAAIRSPLWLDETGSFWEIRAGFLHIWARQSVCFPAYSYILWLSTKLFGTSEIALRIPSVLAMLGAAAIMYRIAREMFDHELGLVATIVFCVNPIVAFEAIDVRPYAFGVLVVNAAILVLLRLRHTESGRMAALFGALAALVVWFHYLFAVILPGLIIVYWTLKRAGRKATWQQFGVAAAVFAVLFLPVIPGLRFLFHTSSSHVFEKPPDFEALYWALAPQWVSPVFALTALFALMMAGLSLRADRQVGIRPAQIVVCICLGLIPVLILFGVSAGTPIHLFVGRHRLVAVPGIALCWVCLLSLVPYRALRLGFCLMLVGLTAYGYATQPDSREHMFSWKAAIDVVDRNASVDGASVLMCSDFPEADYVTLPEVDGTKESRFFAPLSYYKLTVPVYGLPRDLNDQAKRRGAEFVQIETHWHKRFLAMASEPSYPTLEWIYRIASGSYDVHTVGIYDRIKVLEFDPRSRAQGVPDVQVSPGKIAVR